MATAGIGYKGLAELAYQRNELYAALRLVTDGIADSRRLNYPVPLAWGLATLAWIRQARGDQVGALEAIGEAERVVALDTVKKHVSHVLGKLGAADRTEAVTRARELGVIP